MTLTIFMILYGALVAGVAGYLFRNALVGLYGYIAILWAILLSRVA